MTSPGDTPTERPNDDADARFAAYLADVSAHVDDPEEGEECQAILTDNPETQRALFDLSEALTATPGPFPPSVLWIAGATLVIIAAVAVLVVGFLS